MTLIIGIGNELRGDDGLGPELVRLYEREFRGKGAECVSSSGDGFGLMEIWKGSSKVILVDAVAAKAPIGALVRHDITKEPLPKYLFTCSTHAFGLAQTVELARSLNALPPQCLFLGLVGENFQTGAKLSPALRATLPSLKDRVLLEI